MEHKFINREKELQWLEELYKKQGAQFVIIYGRRRVGKTELIKKFIKNKKNLYYLASKGNETEQLFYLSEKCSDIFKEPYLKDNPFKEWRSFFKYLLSKTGKKKLVLVIDEFPFLISSNNAIPSIIQKYWDEELSRKNIFLVLLGSSISMMYDYTLSYSSPLYGRRTGQIRLNTFKFKDYKKFFIKKSIEDIIKFYSVTDGLPFYINFLDKTKTVEENILQNIASPESILYEEGEILVKGELGDVPTYFSILDSISTGKTKIGEIANFVGMDSHSLTRYIKKLLLIELIKKEISITEKITSKKGVYRLSDNFLNFWFRFIYPSKISADGKDAVKKMLDKNFNSYLGPVFEKVCKEFIIDNKNRLPFSFQKIGRWWRKDKEIDLVALNEETKEIGFFEVKWKNLKEKQAVKILEDLKEKSKFVEWNLNNRQEFFGVIAKKIENKSKLRKQGFLVYDLKDF